MSAPTPANPATATAKPTPRRIKSSGTSRGNAWTYVPLVLLSISFILPLLFMISSSFKPRDQILADLTSWRAFVPVGDLSMANYAGVFARAAFPVAGARPVVHPCRPGDAGRARWWPPR